MPPATNSFENLGLKKEIISALTSLQYTVPTQVQREIIPLVLAKKNLAFTAQTGSGKTIGFSIGFFSYLQKKQQLQLLVVVPTRELCMQVGTELKRFGDILDFNVGMLYGGHDLLVDKKTISRRLHVLVATPGRLIQHINFKTIKIGDVKSVVFDESDQMFDNGFYEDCVYIKSRISTQAQIILSSATITSRVDNFLRKFVPECTRVEIGVQIPPSIVQQALFCTILEKKDVLIQFLLSKTFSRAIVFVNTKSKLSSVYDSLLNNNITAAMLSSDLEQKDREKCLANFKEEKFSVLVCTDVAARGLDIKDVDIVINYDIPSRSEFYVHRIGRTGRTGKEGYALSFVCPEDEEDFAGITKEFNLQVQIIDKDFKEKQKE